MSDLQKADTQDLHQQLVAEAKSLGIKSAHLCKPETLEKKIAEAKTKEVPNMDAEPSKVDVSVSDFGAKFLQSIGFEFEWLGKLAAQYNIDRFEYIHKFRAFRAYRASKHVDWVSVNEVGLCNGRRDMCQILLKHSPVSKERQVFDFNWRIHNV